MPKEPLYPHVPKSGQPQFPHVKGQQPMETAGPLPAVTVICPICGKEIEVPEYNAVTSSDALREHLMKEHPRHPLLLQVTVEGGDPATCARETADKSGAARVHVMSSCISRLKKKH